MENILNLIWLVLVSAFCIVGITCIVRDIRKAMNVDDEVKKAIESGEIDNFADPV